MKNTKITMLFAQMIAVFGVCAAEIPELKVDFDDRTGVVKPVNGVGQPPLLGYAGYSMFRYLKEAGIPYSRLHDVGGAFGKNLFVDVPNIFRDFDADETNPANYDFAFTDMLLANLVKNGVEPYFRLGVTIENRADIRAYRVLPPKDYAKWARICEHIIRHYTEGWANGYKWKISHWEIWNEPEGHETPETNCMWRAPFSEYCKFYEVASKHLKSKFPHLMIGGYASCGFYAVTKSRHHVQNVGRYSHLLKSFHEFVSYVREHKCPLDFFSFHCYDNPGPAVVQNQYVRDYLDANGFKNTELSLNEWIPFEAIEQTGSSRQTALITAMLAVMQNGPIDDAEIYDAKCGTGVYSPFFNPVTRKPRKPYWAYYMFNDLRLLKHAVRANSPYPDMYVVAADDGFGSGAVLIANTSRVALPLRIDLDGREITSCRVIDETRTYEEADLPDMIPASSVWRISVKRKGAAKARPDLVAKVAAGELGYARASWFGYDSGDSTRFLQAALDSKARRVIIDRLNEGDWVTKPLKIGSEKDVIFENGAVLLAKKGEFKSSTASMFNIIRATNVTIRGRGTIGMRKADYMQPPYVRAEWRHGITAMGAINLTIDGLTVEETGGDGLYVASDRVEHQPCRNVTVRNCTFARNARQGISVISVDGFLVENSVMRDTLGMPPQAGIDFEPNSPAEVLKNCVLKNCSFDNNEGSGVEIYLATLKASSQPIDIRLENCRMNGNKTSFVYSLGSASSSYPYNDGRVVLEGCEMTGARNRAVSVRRHKYAVGETVFRNCRIEDACVAAPTNAEVMVGVLGMEGAGPDSVRFENLTIRQPLQRKWLEIKGESEYIGMPTIISGEVQVESPKGKTKEVFDAERYAREFPYKPAKPLPGHVEFDASSAKAYGIRPGKIVRFDPICVRGAASSAFVFYADAAREVRLVVLQRRIGKRSPTKYPLTVRKLGSKKRLAAYNIPGFGESEFAFSAPEAGFYSIDANTAANGIAIVGADVPVALDVREDSVRLVGAVGNLYVYVPAKTDVSVFASGDGRKEYCGLVVRDIDGNAVYSNDEILKSVRVALPVEPVSRMRKIELIKPARFVCEDMSFGMSGVPGFLFLSPELYWR